ncbi:MULTISPECIES: alpha-xenorhabdolysin family binary toxin subunit B [unclassified Pseudomonas]|uniref:alpha-xenorhabdolysin family binary toxin subunit B n=1 Tax=unclassified Pseudomonas TaxID=196821 RepID=UPI000D3CCD63|nr:MULTISPECIES: alpha-xenorhabdolysin family binary toxin subunit B [unclassified Pseudomonas]RAU49666.1 hypothetical protein DBP26_002335 [Pseudomonas sp. RIT 409]RAU55595.1 hypothetical protein DBY65_000185 [Pseudomonas sp. RIT 412]
MNSITYLPASIEYPALDAVTLRLSSNGARDATVTVKHLFLQTDYLPTLHNNVVRVDTAIREAHFKAREVVLELNTKIGINVPVLREYQQELQDANGVDEAEIREDIQHQLDKILAAVAKGGAVLGRLHSPLTASPVPDATEQYMSQLAADQERLPAEIQEIKQRQANLEQKRQTLTEAMALIESKSFAQVGKETMLDAKAISQLAMATPEVAVLDQAIELARQTMEKIESLVNYLGLMEARNTIRRQITGLVNDIAAKQSELRLTVLKGDLINASLGFETHRVRFVGELEKIIVSVDTFLAAYNKISTADSSQVAQFGVDAEALAKHLYVMG